MNKKNIIRIAIGVALAVVLCLSVVFILKMKKPENIKFGMSREKLISILDKEKYKHKYTKSETEDGETFITIKEVYLKNIKGSLSVKINNSDMVDYIAFLAEDKNTEENDEVNILYNFLVESYGESSYEIKEEMFKGIYWITDEKKIFFVDADYPIITWSSVEE